MRSTSRAQGLAAEATVVVAWHISNSARTKFGHLIARQWGTRIWNACGRWGRDAVQAKGKENVQREKNIGNFDPGIVLTASERTFLSDTLVGKTIRSLSAMVTVPT